MYRLTEDNHCLRGYRWDDFESGQTINRGIEDNLIIALDRLGEYEDTGLQPEEVADRLEWISVKDRLPSLHENVVMLRNDMAGRFAEVGWWNGETWMNGQAITDVDYWLPLPELPEEEENEN